MQHAVVELDPTAAAVLDDRGAFLRGLVLGALASAPVWVLVAVAVERVVR